MAHSQSLRQEVAVAVAMTIEKEEAIEAEVAGEEPGAADHTAAEEALSIGLGKRVRSFSTNPRHRSLQMR